MVVVGGPPPAAPATFHRKHVPVPVPLELGLNRKNLQYGRLAVRPQDCNAAASAWHMAQQAASVLACAAGTV